MLDLNYITNSILSFYDFKGKDIVHVGAGGGQLIAYSHIAREIRAIDRNTQAVEVLEERIRAEGLEHKVFAIECDFMDYKAKADVVFFEFCLHEMEDPIAALKHAKEMYAHVVILDHAADSKWSWYALEEKKLAKSWKAIDKFEVFKKEEFTVYQEYDTYDDLALKLSVLGDQSLKRIKELEGCKSISIPMPFTLIQI